ncbi:putative clathrin heavy chain [Yarrowia sp. B02]|nr:putative clathrin heavy chain [Yarrowia sp. B02]
MSQDLPITFQEHLQLQSLGVPEASIGFNTCTLQSDRFVCVRETANTGNTVAIIDLHNNNNVVRRNISADSAIMHPTDFVIAVRSKEGALQAFNLETKQRLGSSQLSVPVVFWTWIDSETIGIVTETEILHWKVGSEPVKLTDRHHSLNDCQVINYISNGSWSALVGITQRDGRIAGQIQLYSKERNVSQAIEGHAAAFAKLQLPEGASPSDLFVFANRGKLHAVEIDHRDENPVYAKKQVDIFFPPEAANDFPVAVFAAQKYGVVYVVTKYGFVHVYDLEQGLCIYMNRISSESVFTAAAYQGKGVLCINRKGQVLSVELNERTVVPYILSQLGNASVALAVASRGGLPGADDLYEQQFSQLLNQGDYGGAAKVAASSPGGRLRTPATIQKLKNVQAPPGGISPILQYFSTLLDKGALNKVESVELARPVLQQDRKPLFEKWLQQDKLESSEELGDIVRQFDVRLALQVYVRANVPLKVVAAFAELGEFDSIVPYCEKVGYSPDYIVLLQNIVRVNPDKGAEFATALVKKGEDLNLNKVTDIFLSQNHIQAATAFLLDALNQNLPEQGNLQTRLLEVNLINAPQVADAILGSDMFSHYDRARIASLCEKAGLMSRALENYDDLKDIKRVVVHSDNFAPDALIAYFGKLTVDQTLECLREMLKVNIRQNLQVVVQIATKYSDLVGSANLIKIFEEVGSQEGLYYYLQSIVNLSEDPDVVFKYITSAAAIGQTNEIERVVRENSHYNAEKVKNFLMKDAHLPDQLPLIIVCDKYNFVHDLVLYLYKNQQYKFIEVYVQRVNPARTPQVIGALLDVDCDESIVKDLLLSVVGQVPVAELVEEVEKRNKLKLLLPFLEKTLAGGSRDTALFDALAKIYIDSNNNPEKFLKENSEYDPLVVGKYCEKRDPYLAFICYEKGGLDDELVRITNENAMYKQQARYLLAKQDEALWTKVLSGDEHQRQLVDAVVGTAVPESDSPEAVSIAVKAFMAADLPAELLELLEKIILEPSPFSENANLQNLMILTAVKADKSRVSDYIERLDHYDADDIAQICVDNELFEEAYEIHRKHDKHDKVMGVLTEHIMSLDRAADYAEKVDTPEVYSLLGKAQIDGLRVTDAIASYIKAKDPANHAQVIEIASHAGKDEELIGFLKMARDQSREPAIDSQLLLSYAATDNLRAMQQLLDSPNVANVEAVGDELYGAKNYAAAKILYASISNWAKLAAVLVYLGDHQGAVDSARKASSVKVWKQVNQACIDSKEFRLAQICGLNLIVHAEELSDLVTQYEYHGYFKELISLFEQGLGLERAHMGMFTELAILYSKYAPDQMMEHLKLFWSRVNIPKVIRACEAAHLWPELVFLYCHYDEWDNAALAIMERSSDAFEHSSFKDIVVKVANLEIYYKAINFYMKEAPMLVTDLLAVLAPRIDVSRVVRMFDKSDNLPMIKSFLVTVLDHNLAAVNNAYHSLLIEEEDHATLRDSVDAYDRYDAIDLAQRLEKHDLIFFRQIAAHLYKKNKKFAKSIALSKQDKLWKDAIDTAAVSGKQDVCEELLRYFVGSGNKECYVATLYTCYDWLRQDVVEEVAWRHNLADYTMPYKINVTRESSTLLHELQKDNEERKAKEAAAAAAESETPIIGGGQRLMITQSNGMY